MTAKQAGFYPRVSLQFARQSDTRLIATTRNVIALMTGNASYPTPTPKLDAVTTSVNTFETAVQEALDGGKIAIATRKADRADLLALLRQLAAYVTGNCNADVLTLISSGFKAVKAPSARTLPEAPQDLRLSYTGMTGKLELRFKRSANTLNFSVQVATDPNGPWEDRGIFSNSRITLDRFTPGKVYWARACANAPAGQSAWGGPATAMAV